MRLLVVTVDRWKCGRGSALSSIESAIRPASSIVGSVAGQMQVVDHLVGDATTAAVADLVNVPAVMLLMQAGRSSLDPSPADVGRCPRLLLGGHPNLAVTAAADEGAVELALQSVLD